MNIFLAPFVFVYAVWARACIFSFTLWIGKGQAWDFVLQHGWSKMAWKMAKYGAKPVRHDIQDAQESHLAFAVAQMSGNIDPSVRAQYLSTLEAVAVAARTVGVNLYSNKFEQRSLIHHAAQAGAIEAVIVFLGHEDDGYLNAYDEQGRTILGSVLGEDRSWGGLYRAQRKNAARKLISMGARADLMQGTRKNQSLLPGVWALAVEESERGLKIIDRNFLNFMLQSGVPVGWENNPNLGVFLAAQETGINPCDVSWWVETMEQYKIDVTQARLDGKTFPQVFVLRRSDVRAHYHTLWSFGDLGAQNEQGETIFHMLIDQAYISIIPNGSWMEKIDLLWDDDKLMDVSLAQDQKGVGLREKMTQMAQPKMGVALWHQKLAEPHQAKAQEMLIKIEQRTLALAARDARAETGAVDVARKKRRM